MKFKIALLRKLICINAKIGGWLRIRLMRCYAKQYANTDINSIHFLNRMYGTYVDTDMVRGETNE